MMQSFAPFSRLRDKIVSKDCALRHVMFSGAARIRTAFPAWNEAVFCENLTQRGVRNGLDYVSLLRAQS